MTIILQTEKIRWAHFYFFGELRSCIDFPTRFVPKLKALMTLGFPINFQDGFGTSLLSYALSRKVAVNRGIVNALIELGADVNIVDDGGNTPLYEAVYYKCPIDVIASLITAGSDVNARNKQGMTPFAWAAKYGIFEKYDNNNTNYGMQVAELLLRHGAYPYLCDEWNKYGTDAGENSRIDSLKKLCEQYKSYRYSYNLEQTSEIEAKRDNRLYQSLYSEIVNKLSSYNDITIFENDLKNAIELGYNIDYQDEYSNETLLLASINCENAANIGIPDMLLDYGANPNICDSDYRSPIDKAVYNLRPISLVEHLIVAGAKINDVDAEGLTLFSNVAVIYIYSQEKKDRQYWLDVAQLLLKRGANPYLCTDWRLTTNESKYDGKADRLKELDILAEEAYNKITETNDEM